MNNSNISYDLRIKMSYNFYDTIDFKRFINKYLKDGYGLLLKLSDLIQDIEFYYDETHPELLPEPFQGYFFNFIDEFDFGKYLENRYGWKLSEQTNVTRFVYIENKEDDKK